MHKKDCSLGGNHACQRALNLFNDDLQHLQIGDDFTNYQVVYSAAMLKVSETCADIREM